MLSLEIARDVTQSLRVNLNCPDFLPSRITMLQKQATKASQHTTIAIKKPVNTRQLQSKSQLQPTRSAIHYISFFRHQTKQNLRAGCTAARMRRVHVERYDIIPHDSTARSTAITRAVIG